MDLCNMQRGWLDLPPAHEHHGKAALSAVRRARVHAHMTPNPPLKRDVPAMKLPARPLALRSAAIVRE